MERASRPLRELLGSSGVGLMCMLRTVSSALMGSGSDLVADFRLLLLAGCLVLVGEEVGRLGADRFLVLQRGKCQCVRTEMYCGSIQFRNTTWVFLQEETNDLGIL